MKLKEVLDKTVIFFKDKKFETPRLDAELLLAHGLGLTNRIDLYLKFEQPLSEIELTKCRDLVKRRSIGEPVAYILGEKGFLGLDFFVDSRVLIPRPETEILVEMAESWLKKNQIAKANILDLGTGSGCIGISLAHKFPEANVFCVDKSEDALKVAQINAEKLNVADRVHFFLGDAIEAFAKLSVSPGQFDVILSNPPYIDEKDEMVQKEVRKFEPPHALFSDENGYAALKSWSSQFYPLLKEKSFIGFELGFRQGQEMKNHFESFKIFNRVELVKDLAGLDRYVIGEK